MTSNWKNQPVVLTSINPHAGLEHQLRCFARWKSLGFRVQTFNVVEEAAMLLDAGIPEPEIRIIAGSRTGAALFGKPTPKIASVFDTAIHRLAFRSCILVNADLYPAVRSANVVRYWKSQGPAVALTREECLTVDAYNFIDHSPYRGGLDAFFMTKPALRTIAALLGRFSVYRRMSFGVPGWDYLLGAAILSKQVGGVIMDSGMLLHPTHKQTYSDINEFANYLTTLRDLGAVRNTETASAAMEFASRIDSECRRNSAKTKIAKMIYFRHTPGGHSAIPAQTLTQVRDVLDRLYEHAPVLTDYYPLHRVAQLAATLDAAAPAFERAAWLFVDSQSDRFRFLQMLFALLFVLHGRTEKRGQPISMHYKHGGHHAAALKAILACWPEGSPLRRVEVARLFAGDLINHNVFNPRLYNYLVLSCENEMERSLLGQVRQAADSRIIHETA